MERRCPIIHLAGASMGKNATDNIASALSNWASTERQQFLWGLNKLHSNELNRIVTELSLMQSVFSICLCI